MQLVAYGAQDIYLTGNPQITFFKVVYRRHTNFSMESIEQTFNGQNELGGKVTSVISRNGDLIHKMYVGVTFSNAGDNFSANFGTTLLKTVELEIGGQRIERFYNDWLETWTQLTQVNPAGKIARLNTADYTNTGSTLYQKMTGSGGVLASNQSNTGQELTIPLPFWFCRNVGLALPLIALQYHEVKIEVEIAGDAQFGGGGTKSIDPLSLWVDYIYLDTDERRRFAQVSHEYLIEQVQRTVASGLSGQMELNFNHPVKELIWIGAPAVGASDYGTATPKSWIDVNQNVNLQLRLNGHDRFEKRNGLYFSRCQVWQYHSGFGGVIKRDSIGVYSFALKPEEHQPSGTCNFSRIDDARLVISDGDLLTNLIVYAVNYNVLRIMSGMGGLAYSN